jgi:hypothetical protein
MYQNTKNNCIYRAYKECENCDKECKYNTINGAPVKDAIKKKIIRRPKNESSDAIDTNNFFYT